jgi:hypothetical protein
MELRAERLNVPLDLSQEQCEHPDLNPHPLVDIGLYARNTQTGE